VKGNHTLFIQIVKILFFTSLLSSCANYHDFIIHDCEFKPSMPVIAVHNQGGGNSLGAPLSDVVLIKAEGVTHCLF